MADKSYKVLHGAHVNLEIPVKRGVAASSQAERRAPLQPSDPDDDPVYAFAKRGITFYDLDTRRNDDGSYSYITFESFPTLEFGIPNLALRDIYERAMVLFSDPKKAIKIPQAAEYLYFDAVFRKDAEERRELIGNADKRPFVKDIPLHGAEAAENVTDTNWKKGVLSFTGDGEWSLAVESAFFYNSFDTGDTANFKVTDVASYDSESVDFHVTGGQQLRVHLTPRAFWFAYDTGETGDGGLRIIRYYTGRFPVLPRFEPVKDAPFITVEVSDGMAQAHALPQYWARIGSYLSDFYPFWDSGLSWIDDLASAFSLVAGLGLRTLSAIIIKGEQTFYVWRKDTTDVIKWQRTRLYNPDY